MGRVFKLALVAGVAAAVVKFGWVELFPNAKSYVGKLKAHDPAVEIRAGGMVRFALTVTNRGRKKVEDVPVEVECTVTVTGAVPRKKTVNTGPVRAGESRPVTAELGPFPLGPFTAPSCKYQINEVRLAP